MFIIKTVTHEFVLAASIFIISKLGSFVFSGPLLLIYHSTDGIFTIMIFEFSVVLEVFGVK